MSVRPFAAAAALSMIFALPGCSGGNKQVNTKEDFSNIPVPPPPPAPSGVRYTVRNCLTQSLPPGDRVGRITTVGQSIFPDTLTIDLSRPAGFPNGRLLTDPVGDIMLAYVFLDLGKHGSRGFADLPLNPAANDVRFATGFPYLAPAQGNPPRAATNGANFDFVDAKDTEYDRVDRMGMPLVATALVPFVRKPAYNDADPGSDVNGDFVGNIEDELSSLTNAFADDIQGLGFSLCASQ